MEVVCLILGPMLASQPCSHAFWVLTSLHLLSFLLKMFFIILTRSFVLMDHSPRHLECSHFIRLVLYHITCLAPSVHLLLHVHEISAEMNTTLLHNKNAFSNVRLNLIAQCELHDTVMSFLYM